jgi:hypothetical protein
MQTQDLVRKAEENFPQLDKNTAIQEQANMGPGREAVQGEGQPSCGGGIINVSVAENKVYLMYILLGNIIKL